MDICVIGTGYVGLVTGTVLSDLGNDVICADNDLKKIGMLKNCEVPIYEPGLAEMVQRNVQERRLKFSTNISESVRKSDIVFIAVGTPLGKDGYADMSAVRQVAQIIGSNLNRYKIIVNKSTVPVGAGDMVREIIETTSEEKSDFDVVSNPEFLREGSAVYDTLFPDRIVIGAADPEAAACVAELYAPLKCPVVFTDNYSAEMIKYASNAFLATKISFINSIAEICEEAGADVAQVAKGMGYDKRIGNDFLNAGLGYGGSCFGKDTSCLVRIAHRHGYSFDLLKSVIEINSRQPKRFVEKMCAELGTLRGRVIGILGLAFKPNTDDLRDAKSIEIIAQLLAEGASVRAYDPVAMENARVIFPQVSYCSSPYEAVNGADAAAVITEWDEFGSLDLAKIKDVMARAIIFDGRNIYDPQQMKLLGIKYYCIGRAEVKPEPVNTVSADPLPFI